MPKMYGCGALYSNHGLSDLVSHISLCVCTHADTVNSNLSIYHEGACAGAGDGYGARA